MASVRKQKRKAQQAGLSVPELQLVELLREVLDLLHWNQVLGYANQYLLHEKLAVPPAERQRVMAAAAAAVAQDGRLQQWGQRLAEVRQALLRIDAELRGSGAGPSGEARAAAEAADGR